MRNLSIPTICKDILFACFIRVACSKRIIPISLCYRYVSGMTTEDNGNVSLLKPTSSSNEDLSEYTDADESISAPTEFLAEVK